MRKIYFIFCLLILVGCSDVKPSTNDIVANAVIQTLTAIPPVLESSIATLTPSITISAPLTTQIPSIQIANIQKPLTLQTVTPTNIPFVSIAQDHFTKDAAGFGISGSLEDETMMMEIVNGNLNIYPKMKDGWRNWRLRPPEIGDGIAEVKFKFNSCQGADKFGIIVRAPDYSSGNGYYGSISCDGRILVQRNESTLVDVPIIQNLYKINEFNTLQLFFVGNKIEIFLNGEKTAETTDETLKRGYCGFFTAPMNQNSLSISIDDFTIYSPQGSTK